MKLDVLLNVDNICLCTSIKHNRYILECLYTPSDMFHGTEGVLFFRYDNIKIIESRCETT
jgi:hypothetical protein